MLSQMNCLYVKAFFDTNINKNVYPNNIECHLKLLVVGKTEIKNNDNSNNIKSNNNYNKNEK